MLSLKRLCDEVKEMLNNFKQNIKTFYNPENTKTFFKEKRISFIHQWLLVFTLHLVLELIFLFASGLGLDYRTMTRILLFSITSTSIVVLIAHLFKAKYSHMIVALYLLVNSIFALSQLGYKNYVGSFFSFRTVITKLGAVEEYALDFLMYLRIEFLLVLVPVVLYFVGVKYILKKHEVMFDVRRWGTFLVSALIIHGIAIFSLSWWPQTTVAITLQELYYRPTQLESAMRQFGVSRFMMRDLYFTFSSDNDEIDLIPEEPPVDIEVPIDLERIIDDSEWRWKMERESDESIKTIDQYLLSRQITPRNEMTGVLKDKNVIYIMVEALDFVAMDPAIAPHLTKMMNEGWYFENYYSPTSACSTGDSELMSITSILSIPGVCSHDAYYTNRFSHSLFELFKSEGYYASSYHNYSDWYYMRNQMHNNMGSEAYYDFDRLEFGRWIQWPNWPSDYDLMVKSLDKFIDADKFFSFIITVNMHNPYDIPSNFGDKYYDEVRALYPDASEFVVRYKSKVMETDRGLGYMLETLEESGKLDDTVIVLFSDHHMLKTPFSIIDQYSEDIDRLYGYNIHHTPMVIYNSTIEPMTVSTVASTKDLVPTLANLFDLYYDPRVYLGVDIFSEEADHFVLFQDGGWLVEEGYYNPVFQMFVPNDEEVFMPDEEILRMNQYSRSLYQLSEALFNTDYFRHRRFVRALEYDPDLIR